jgi:hypothetical protein
MPKLKEPPFKDDPGFNTQNWSQSWFEWLRDVWQRTNEKISFTGTWVANHFVKFNASGELVDSGKIAPSGDVVGTSDSQTLTNKTVDKLDITDAPTLEPQATNKQYVDGFVESSIEADWEDDIDYLQEYVEGYVLAYYDGYIKDWAIDYVASIDGLSGDNTQTIITAIQAGGVGGVGFQYKSRTLSIKDGWITDLGTESGWTDV